MHGKPRYVDLCEAVRQGLNELSRLTRDNLDLRMFCELNHIVDLTIEGELGVVDDPEDVSDGFLTLCVRYDKSVHELAPLCGVSLEWLERYYGAVLKLKGVRPSAGGGGYVDYQLLRPPLERLEKMYPKEAWAAETFGEGGHEVCTLRCPDGAADGPFVRRQVLRMQQLS